MNALNLGILACCSVFSAAGTAADETSPDILSGRVEGIYTKLQPGIFVETKHAGRDGEIWAEIRRYQAGESHSRDAMLMIRTAFNVERGDIVTFLPADDSLAPVNSVPREARIVAISAKRGEAPRLAATLPH